VQQGKRAGPSGEGETASPSTTPTVALPNALGATTSVMVATPMTTPTVATPDPAELDCLAAAVYYEARGEAPEGQAAVAQVVLNRVGQARFAKTVCGVVYQGAKTHACQFSFACHGRLRHVREEAAWTRSRAVAQRALSGYVMRTVGRATYFHLASLGHVQGAHEAPVVRLGHHIFYASANRRDLRHAYRVLQADAKAVAAAPPSDNQAAAGGDIKTAGS
jgi:spore germination cell wall hydrolase CwlJ-like protein